MKTPVKSESPRKACGLSGLNELMTAFGTLSRNFAPTIRLNAGGMTRKYDTPRPMSGSMIEMVKPERLALSGPHCSSQSSEMCCCGRRPRSTKRCAMASPRLRRSSSCASVTVVLLVTIDTRFWSMFSASRMRPLRRSTMRIATPSIVSSIQIALTARAVLPRVTSSRRTRSCTERLVAYCSRRPSSTVRRCAMHASQARNAPGPNTRESAVTAAAGYQARVCSNAGWVLTISAGVRSFSDSTPSLSRRGSASSRRESAPRVASRCAIAGSDDSTNSTAMARVRSRTPPPRRTTESGCRSR